MFEAETPSPEDVAPIRMQADAQHPEMILKLAHPGHISPAISDAVTLAELLRIAKQYDMECVKDQLRAWFTRPCIENGVLLDTITVVQPLASFVVAISFDCVDEARYALKEVIKCDLEQELGACKKYEIPLYLMQYILKLGNGRTTWLKTRARRFWMLVREYCRTIATTQGNSSATREEAADLLDDSLEWEKLGSEVLEARPSFKTLKDLLCDATVGVIPLGMFRNNDLKVVWKMIAELEESNAELESAPLPELDETLGV